MKTLKLTSSVIYDDSIGEYVIKVNGEVIGYASTQGKAWEIQAEALRLQKRYLTRGYNEQN